MSIEQSKQWKRSLRYFRKRQMVEEELTFERFIYELQCGMEFFFTYRTHTIDIAFHYEDSKIIYEININGYANNACYHSFTSVDELVSYPIIDNKNIQELWNDLET